MEQGILFLKPEKAPVEYQKSFCFAETPRSDFWDGNDPTGRTQPEVTREEAQFYDLIMQKIIAARVY